ncbi:MAG: flagellar biosynthesis protein FlgN [Rhodobacteraceae bacterium]|nr:flagellar biosynthesis protein FlgN [Paracoccaceae bacterium]
MDNLINDNAAEIEDLLDAERDALLEGDFDAVRDLKDRKEELLASLLEHRAGLSPESYAQLSEKAARNQSLLAGAARGIAAVRQRLQEIRDARTGNVSYDAEGRRPTPLRASSLEKRA